SSCSRHLVVPGSKNSTTRYISKTGRCDPEDTAAGQQVPPDGRDRLFGSWNEGVPRVFGQLRDAKPALWKELDQGNSKGWHLKVFPQWVLLEKRCGSCQHSEGSCQATTVRLSDVTLSEKRRVPKGLLAGGDVLEYNNNIHVINSTENGKIEASVSKSLSEFYALHKKACSKRHHSQLSLKVENSEQDDVWKTSTCITQEHLNGNVLPQLEKVFYHVPAETKESANVEVRMIDFAHVFPSNAKDEGYIYGLKNLIRVLQNILDN
uniref:Inositol polyphosphate multikinase n=1 Tax=Cyanistes caeruleus TaxID=156563 RepID=A0A8C0VJA9_CYACU